MTGRLVGRKAVVTGGATGIGRAIAAAFLREGAAVVVADINGSAAALAARELAPLGTVHAVCCDVTQSGAVGELAAAAVDRLGSVNVLVNNAGLSGR